MGDSVLVDPHAGSLPRTRGRPRFPTATVERPGAGVKGSLRRFAPLTPVPVRSKTRLPTGIGGREWSGLIVFQRATGVQLLGLADGQPRRRLARADPRRRPRVGIH